MIHVLIEESYINNNRCDLILEGILSVTRKKRVAVRQCTRKEELGEHTRVVILICASLKWATDMIDYLTRRGIHPLLFGFQYIDTMYQYSCITLTYTKTTYLLTRYILSKNPKKTAFLGHNKDSMPDKLKYTGVEYAAREAGVECTPFQNDGDIRACIDEFAKVAEDYGNVVCCNDAVTILLRSLYPELCEGRRICSCSGMKLGECLPVQHPTTSINYFKAGRQLAELYLFLERRKEIGSTFMTMEMDLILDDGGDAGEFAPESFLNSAASVDFYGDPDVHELECLENMLVKCDALDMSILRHVSAGVPYEQIAEIENLAVNTVKYRVHAMLKNADIPSKRTLLDLIAKYDLRF